LTSVDGDFKTANLNVVATFELQPNRIPHSSTGLWCSSPNVELYGSALGATSAGGIFSGGDSWSKLFMHRRQTILQFLPGGNFPIIIVIAERKEEEALIQ
jgi:hypothetical protein